MFFSYKHALDGFVRVWREEGFTRLFSGASTATMRAVLMTVGQLSFYDQVKQILLASGYFGDNSTTHFLSSLTAVSRKQLKFCFGFFISLLYTRVLLQRLLLSRWMC